jgi:hypothetical protein
MVTALRSVTTLRAFGGVLGQPWDTLLLGSHKGLRSVTTLHAFGGVLGQPWDTLLLGPRNVTTVTTLRSVTTLHALGGV